MSCHAAEHRLDEPRQVIPQVASPQSPLPFHLAKAFYLYCGTAQTSMAVPAVPAVDEVAAAGEPLPTYDRAPPKSPPGVPPAYPAAPHNRTPPANAPGCNDPRSLESTVPHPP